MTTTIVVFISSFFIALVFLTLKTIEIKYEKRNIFCELLGKFDATAHKLIVDLKFKSLQLIQSARYIVLIEAKEFAKKLFEKLEQKIINEYHAHHIMIMGQKEIATTGSASFYLRKITEDKNNGTKGKIEDSL
jgi:hypothetical protein